MGRMKKAVTKSKLVKQTEKFFSQQAEPLFFPDFQPAYPGEPRIVPSYTTYSVCEDPIPGPRKQQ
jgi:hypothetical protein